MRVIFLLLTCISLLGCNWASDQVTDSFIIVDKSLQQSNANLQESFKDKYSTLSAGTKRKMTGFITAKMRSLEIIDSLNEILTNTCEGEADLNCVENLMIVQEQSIHLQEAMFNLKAEGEKLVDRTDSLHALLLESDITEASFFQRIPEVAGHTLLEKLKNDCENYSKSILDQIISEPKK